MLTCSCRTRNIAEQFLQKSSHFTYKDTLLILEYFTTLFSDHNAQSLHMHLGNMPFQLLVLVKFCFTMFAPDAGRKVIAPMFFSGWTVHGTASHKCHKHVDQDRATSCAPSCQLSYGRSLYTECNNT